MREPLSLHPRSEDASGPPKWPSFPEAKLAASPLLRGLAGVEPSRVTTLSLLGAAERKGPLRLIGERTQQGEHMLPRRESRLKRLRLSAVLPIRKIAREMHLVAAERQPPTLKRSELIGEASNVAKPFHGEMSIPLNR